MGVVNINSSFLIIYVGVACSNPSFVPDNTNLAIDHLFSLILFLFLLSLSSPEKEMKIKTL